MTNIKWIFNPLFLKYELLPFMLLTISFIIMIIATVVFVQRELKNDKKGEKKNEKN